MDIELSEPENEIDQRQEWESVMERDQVVAVRKDCVRDRMIWSKKS